MEFTLNLSENIYRKFSELAEKKHRRVEEIITDKLQDYFSGKAANFETTVAAWSDKDVLTFANLKFPEQLSMRMNELSDKVQSGKISKV